MKKKYFRGVGLNDAKLGYNPSYIWRSFWSVIDLVKDGILWRVGDGRKISVWHDRWLSCPSSYKVQCPQTTLPLDAKVNLLIDVQTGCWKKDFIFDSFNTMDAKQICKLPLSRWGVEDRIKDLVGTWGKDKIEANMESKCARCCEDVFVEALDVWAKDESPVRKWSNTEIGFTELRAIMFLKLSIEEVELMACTMRKLWLRRNLCLFEDQFDEPKKSLKNTKLAWAEFKEANLIEQRGLGTRAMRREDAKWEKPEVGRVKANWDAAVDATNRRVGIAVVVRDDQGEVLACLCSAVENQEGACQA
ncbi:uncharacterized protein LOC121247327 [Juglans microcarpa x Juglans regia]|uniref:uncharacterized protein LOC121247327 n=1 Tax=Juglans microcarpa x Juglans regia TaxID=2249226 RepID=UPI001B7EA5D0|nr:uncharacterized protein LOC121247327 [Juglans microcarpa x Juglans regia]